MNYKKLKEWTSGFVNWVLLRHPKQSNEQNGFMGGFIYGERGSGKSTYSYKTEAKTYYELEGYSKTDDEEDAYKLALQYMMYDPSDFRKLLIYNKLNRIITPIVCLDDASMHFGNMLHITNPEMYSALLGETATVRTAVTGFLITAPQRKHVAKFLRDYDDFKGEVKTDGSGGHSPGRETPTWNRKVRFYKWNYYPDEVKYRIQIPFQDKYSCYIPEPFYSWYIEKKLFFELKHELEIADRVDKSARETFIRNRQKLPSYPGQIDLNSFLDKWEREAEEQKREDIRQEQLRKMREYEHQKKYESFLKKVEVLSSVQEKTADFQ